MKKDEIIVLLDSLADLEPHYFDETNIWLFDKAIPLESLQIVRQNAKHWIALDVEESLKSLSSIGDLSEKILELRHSRPLRLIALGGGALGDAIGFLASILWRGVGLIHVPTTLLAMIDSSIGGKTAINLASKKNQLGSFYRAQEIIYVKTIIEGLPERLKREGRAEMVKSAWLDCEESVVEIAKLGPTSSVDEWSSAITCVAAFKKRIVAQDPFDDKDIRMQLNFGHSVAHGIERLLELSHGESVAWGLLCAALIGKNHGLSADHSALLFDHASRIIRPHSAILHLEPTRFVRALEGDKKRKNGQFRSVILTSPGRFHIREDISEMDWFYALKEAYAILNRPRRLAYHQLQRRVRIYPPLSKSEHIRILSLAASNTKVDSDDTFYARQMFSEKGAHTFVGEGATGFRFLAIREAFASSESIQLELAETLAKRNHRELWDLFDDQNVDYQIDAKRIHISGKRVDRLQIRLPKQSTSHIASGVALLAAHGIQITLEWDEIASFPYFEMTLNLLEECGIKVDRNLTGRRVSLLPTTHLDIPEIDMDAGAYAFWRILQARGVKVDLGGKAKKRWQPDFNIDVHLATMKNQQLSIIDLNASPDLAPVLAAFAALEGKNLQIVGARHLRNKESNRIEDLLAMLRAVGVKCESHEDGFLIEGDPSSLHRGSVNCQGDHRLVMAAALLATGVEVELSDPMCVSKSYWNFWQDLRSAGFLDLIPFRD